MTATNICYNFVGFRCSPPLTLAHTLPGKLTALTLAHTLPGKLTVSALTLAHTLPG